MTSASAAASSAGTSSRMAERANAVARAGADLRRLRAVAGDEQHDRRAGAARALHRRDRVERALSLLELAEEQDGQLALAQAEALALRRSLQSRRHRGRLDPVAHDHDPLRDAGRRGMRRPQRQQLVALGLRRADRPRGPRDRAPQRRPHRGQHPPVRAAHEVQAMGRPDRRKPGEQRQGDRGRRVAVGVNEVRSKSTRDDQRVPRGDRRRARRRRAARRQRDALVAHALDPLEQVDVGLRAAAAMREDVQDRAGHGARLSALGASHGAARRRTGARTGAARGARATSAHGRAGSAGPRRSRRRRAARAPRKAAAPA